jgi:hypothetical protein
MILCRVCGKHVARATDYRFIESLGMQGKTYVCKLCFGLNDETLVRIVREELDPEEEFYAPQDVELDNMTVEELEKEDLICIIYIGTNGLVRDALHKKSILEGMFLEDDGAISFNFGKYQRTYYNVVEIQNLGFVFGSVETEIRVEFQLGRTNGYFERICEKERSRVVS